jgi:hypothetical protein
VSVNGHWVYFTNPLNNKVHLADFDTIGRGENYESTNTLCGVPLDGILQEGDETVSGLMATCHACLNRRES